MKRLIPLLLLLGALSASAQAPLFPKAAHLQVALTTAQEKLWLATWFVRQDGGTLYNASTNPTGQCNGLSDAAYTSGVNQPCAVSQVQYLYLPGVYGEIGWNYGGVVGGDTIVIRGCAALPSETNSDPPHCRIGYPNATNSSSLCAGIANCAMPPLPSGTLGAHTRLIGGCAYGTYTCTPIVGYPVGTINEPQLFGGYNVFNGTIDTTGESYVDYVGLEITSHNGACTRRGSPVYPAGCSTSSPYSDFADAGIWSTNTSCNLTFQDIYVHAFTSNGFYGAICGTDTLTRVESDFNVNAGWNFDDGTMNASGAVLAQSHVTMVGNGCLEQYPIANPQYPALACWDSNDGGFGDAWSGQPSNLAGFSCDQCLIAYNVKDAAMGPHTLIHNLSVTRSAFIGNMGAAGKWGTDANSTTLIQNNLYISNCNALSTQIPGAAQNFNISTGLPGSYLSLFCRTSYTDMFAYFSDANSTVNFVGNTFIDPTFQTMFDLGCNTSNNCGSTPYNFIDNIMLGYTTTGDQPPFTGESPGEYYKQDSSVVVSPSYNVEYGTRNNSCDSSFPGSHIICSNPLLTSEPAQGSYPPESVFFPYYTLTGSYWYPASLSPAIHAGIPVSGLTMDYYGATRPNPPSIGAVEPAGSTPGGGTAPVTLTISGTVVQ